MDTRWGRVHRRCPLCHVSFYFSCPTQVTEEDESKRSVFSVQAESNLCYLPAGDGQHFYGPSFLWPQTASVPSRTMRGTSKLIRCSEMPRTEWSNWAKFPSCTTIWKPKIFLERFLSKQLQIKSRLLDSNHLLSSRTAKNWWHLLQRAISVLASASTCSRISQSVADQPRAFKYLQPRRAHN